MEFETPAFDSARPEALGHADEAAGPRPSSREWRFDALTWCTLRLGRLGPVRRAIARHMEARIRARGELPASALRHPVAVEQDKVALGLTLLGAAERGLARGQLSAPALRAMLRNLYSGVFVHRGGTSAKPHREGHMTDGQAPTPSRAGATLWSLPMFLCLLLTVGHPVGPVRHHTGSSAGLIEDTFTTVRPESGP